MITLAILTMSYGVYPSPQHVAQVAPARKLLIVVYVLLHDASMSNDDKFARSNGIPSARCHRCFSTTKLRGSGGLRTDLCASSTNRSLSHCRKRYLWTGAPVFVKG